LQSTSVNDIAKILKTRRIFIPSAYLIDALTPAILREFIDKVVVYHREKVQDVMTQRVDVHFKLIGHVQLPVLNQKQLAGLQLGFGREDALPIAA
jgi:hypothetical protein